MMRYFFVFYVALLSSVVQAQPSGGWASKDAHISTSDFLELYFNLGLHNHENLALNSFNLISFYPGDSPEQALVVVVQTYNDDGHSTDDPKFRQEIRKTADGMVSDFVARFGLPILKKRWSPEKPKAAIVIRHVRVNDLQDTLGVTVDGITSFEAEDIKRAERRVRSVRGVWSW